MKLDISYCNANNCEKAGNCYRNIKHHQPINEVKHISMFDSKSCRHEDHDYFMELRNRNGERL